MVRKIKMTTQWLGGKPIGWINDTQVCFSNQTGLKSKYFNPKDYGSKEKALSKAKQYQLEISNENNLTKNRYRFVTDKNGNQYMEVQLQNNIIMKCEPEHLPFVEERIWTANKSKNKYTYYVKSRESKKRKQNHILFHNLVYPELKHVDHINRDGLDNRKVNIREGSGRVNANNKRLQKNNKSGKKGVYKEEGTKARWCAQWKDISGKKHKKSWSIKKYGEEEAYNLACQYREQEMKVVNAFIQLDGAKNLLKIIKKDDYELHYYDNGAIIATPLEEPEFIIEE